MTRNELIIAIAIILLVTFIFGWLARWFFDRLNTSKPLASDEAMDRLREAEERIEEQERQFADNEAQYANAYAQLEAELDAAMTGLGDSRREAAALRQLLEARGGAPV